MRLAASILRFFLCILQFCGSPWLALLALLALFARQRLDTRTLTFPRVRTPQPRTSIAHGEAILFQDRYRWWPFAMGPPIGASGK